jgi:hypothetical protein
MSTPGFYSIILSIAVAQSEAGGLLVVPTLVINVW